MTEWDRVFDLVVVGSGGGAMAAALAAQDAGASVLVLEKREVVGGSTAMSGGVMWIPNNPLMAAEGVRDSYADALTHMETVVGDVGPASSDERRHAYLTGGPELVAYLQRRGVQFIRCPGYSDYYSNLPGGHDQGRSIEPAPWDGHKLGPWLPRLQVGLAASIGFVIKTNESRTLMHFNRSPSAFARTVQIVVRTYFSKLRGQHLLTNGASLIGQMLKIAIEGGVTVWTEAPVQDLVVEDGRITGVIATPQGATVRIQARNGVLLAAGGFAHNAKMREQYSGDQANRAEWTAANPGDTGEVLDAAIRIGAKTDLMDEAWWLPLPLKVQMAGSTLSSARQRPGAIFVDAAGQRFVNEANSYMEIGKAMYERDKTSKAVPCWLIMDDGYRRRYSHTRSIVTGRFPKDLTESGLIKKADTLQELARQCGIDPQGLADSIAHFNQNAAKGVDPDYGRGESAYNRNLGDPGHKPNPALGPLDRAPYYALEIYPSDIGTCGGLLTDADARVLDQDGSPIAGLYATGNTTATVMGRRYLGAGASIGNSMVFGYLAALHATARTRPSAPPQ